MDNVQLGLRKMLLNKIDLLLDIFIYDSSPGRVWAMYRSQSGCSLSIRNRTVHLVGKLDVLLVSCMRAF